MMNGNTHIHPNEGTADHVPLVVFFFVTHTLLTTKRYVRTYRELEQRYLADERLKNLQFSYYNVLVRDD